MRRRCGTTTFTQSGPLAPISPLTPIPNNPHIPSNPHSQQPPSPYPRFARSYPHVHFLPTNVLAFEIPHTARSGTLAHYACTDLLGRLVAIAPDAIPPVRLQTSREALDRAEMEAAAEAAYGGGGGGGGRHAAPTAGALSPHALAQLPSPLSRYARLVSPAPPPPMTLLPPPALPVGRGRPAGGAGGSGWGAVGGGGQRDDSPALSPAGVADSYYSRSLPAELANSWKPPVYTSRNR